MASDGQGKGANLIEYQFKQGKSGFEGRRHKYAYYRSLVEELNPTAVEILREAMLFGTSKEKIVAAKVVLEFGLGKPAVELPDPDDLNDDKKAVTITLNNVKVFKPKYKQEENIIDATISPKS